MVFRKSSFSYETGCVEVDTDYRVSSHSGGTGCVEVGAAARKSSYSHTGGCVEVDAVEYQKSSFSGGDCCVEVGMGFVKAEASNPNGSCVEVGAEFVKSSQSNQWECVEVGADTMNVPTNKFEPGDVVIRLRDSKQKDSNGNHYGPVLEFTKDEWVAFLKGMDAGPNCEFNIVLPDGTKVTDVGGEGGDDLVGATAGGSETGGNK